MLPIVHLISGLILTGFIFPFVGWQAIFIAIGSFLIDVDHYIYCIYNNKDLSLRNCYWWHRKDNARDELHLFHTVEVWTLLIIASFYSQIVFLFSIGLFYHMVFDFLEIFTKKLYGRRSISVTGWLMRRKRFITNQKSENAHENKN